MYFPSYSGDPIKGNTLYGERSNPDTAGISRWREMEHCIWHCDDRMGQKIRHSAADDLFRGSQKDGKAFEAFPSF